MEKKKVYLKRENKRKEIIRKLVNNKMKQQEKIKLKNEIEYKIKKY